MKGIVVVAGDIAVVAGDIAVVAGDIAVVAGDIAVVVVVAGDIAVVVAVAVVAGDDTDTVACHISDSRDSLHHLNELLLVRKSLQR